MRLSTLPLCGAISLVSVGAMAADGRGLSVDSELLGWPQWHARLQMTMEPALSQQLHTSIEPVALRPRSAALFGDYYVAKPYFGQSGGVRVTSGLMLGARGGVFGLGQTSTPGLFSVSTTARSAWSSAPSVDGTEGAQAWPYLGIGYSDSSLRSGFSFSADLGLAAPGQSVARAARTLGTQSLDEFVRDLRLTPVLQLGVSYRF